MEKSNKGVVIFLILILVIVLGIGAIFIYKIEQQNIVIAELKEMVENKENYSNLDNTNNKTNTTTEISNEETIKKLFLNKLKELSNNNPGEILDYRVDSIYILTGSDKEHWVNYGYKSTDVLAKVTYSLKCVNANKWDIGNGEVQGDWVVNKVSFECLRNGKLSEGFATSF